MISISPAAMNALESQRFDDFLQRCRAFLENEKVVQQPSPPETLAWLRARAQAFAKEGFVSEQAICMLAAIEIRYRMDVLADPAVHAARREAHFFESEQLDTICSVIEARSGRGAA